MPHDVLADDGTPLDAHFDIEDGDIIFQSRGGTRNTPTMRNGDYGPGLRLILKRLREGGRTVVGAWVDTSETGLISLEDRSILDGTETDLTPTEQFRQMSAKMKPIGRSPDARPGGGSTTKRIRLRVGFGQGEDLVDLIRLPDTRASNRDGIASPLEMLADTVLIDRAMKGWHSALETGARSTTTSRRWLAEAAIMVSSKVSEHRADGVDVELGVRSSGAPWTVQMNAPARAANANGLTTVASDKFGQLFLLRQGRLHANPDSNGEIVGERFRSLSGLTPVAVHDDSTPQRRDWYLVARLDGDSASICSLLRERGLQRLSSPTIYRSACPSLATKSASSTLGSVIYWTNSGGWTSNRRTA